MTVSYKRSKPQIFLSDWNFEDEVGETTVTGWAVTGNFIVQASRLGHKAICAWGDISAGAWAMVRPFVSTQDYGTIEFYMGCNDVTKGFHQRIVSAAGMEVGINMEDDKFYYGSGVGDTWTEIVTAPTPTDGQWYHISLRWRGTAAGAYQGLAAGFYKIFIDGVEYGDYAMSTGVICTQVHLRSDAGDSGHILYIDAIGFADFASDAPGTYSIGDNLTLEVDATISNSDVYRCEIEHSIQDFPTAEISVSQDEIIDVGSIIEVKDWYTTASSSTDAQVIFEGMVTKKDNKYPPKLWLESFAREMDQIKPSGDYAGRTDEIITSLISDYCDYITKDTFSTGTAMGTVTFAGDKTLRRILDDFAKTDQFIWYLSPEGAMFYNDGSTDSGEVVNETTGIWAVKSKDMDLHINKIEILGGIQSDGTQASGSAEDTTSQGIYGIIKFKDTDATLLTDALCDAKAAAILANVQYPPQKAWFYDDVADGDDVGFQQVGENDTFGYETDEMDEIVDALFIINSIKYYCVSQIYKAFITSGLLFNEKSDTDIVQENSHLILQNTTNVATNTTDVATKVGVGDIHSEAVPLMINNCTQTGLNFTCTNGQYFSCAFYLHDHVDASADVVFEIIHGGTADASVTMVYYVGANPVDGTIHVQTWNIVNGGGTAFAQAVLNAGNKYTLTVANAGLANNDIVIFQFGVNEAARTINAYSCTVNYTWR